MSEERAPLATARELGQRATRTFPVRLIQKFIADRGPNQAVLIAWNFLQSLIPIILILLAIGGYALRLLGMDPDSIHDFVFRFTPAGNDTRRALVAAISGVQQHSGVFAILALLSFLWSSSSLFGCLEQVMADAYGIATRNFLRQKLVAFALMLLFCVLIVIAVGGTTLTAVFRDLESPLIPDWITHGAAEPALTAVIGVASGLILFFAIFWIVPQQHPKPHRAVPGAIFSGVAFYALTLVFPLYLQLNQGINRYGSQFAFLFTLLFFFYFVGLITVLGIEINSVLFPLPRADPATAAAVPAPGLSRSIPRPVFGALGGGLAIVLALLAAWMRSTAPPSRSSR